jgi:HEAT repeat protein
VSDLRALVEHYLLEWSSSRWAHAYHSLIELGPRILPELESRFAESRDSALRAALVELAQQLHSADALPLFAAALEDEAPEVWKQALDGLVDLASPGSLLLLESALAHPPPGETSPGEWASWVQEAIQQVRAEQEARGGAA